MSVYFVKYVYEGEHRGNTHPHAFFVINILSDFKSELISLWDSVLKFGDSFTFLKGYLCSEPFKKGKTPCLKLDLINQTLRI